LAPPRPRSPRRRARREFLSAALAAGLGVALGFRPSAVAADSPVRVRLGTLAPKGSSYVKHLQAMGEKWRHPPGRGARLTIHPGGTMGGEADMVRRMRIGQLQAGMLTAVGLAEIEPGVTGLQNLPMMFRSLDEVDYIGWKLQPILKKRLKEKGFVVLFWGDSGWVRFFSEERVLRPDDLRKTRLFVSTGSASAADIYRAVGLNPVPLEAVDILPSLQTGLSNAVALPPSFALAGQVDRVASHMLDLAWAPLVGAAVVTVKAWQAMPPGARDALHLAAAEAGNLIRADSRRESAESVEAMRKRGLQVHTPTPEIETEWRREAEAAYPAIRGTIVPAAIFDQVVRELLAYRASSAGGAK
jgi:TRAP-type C4-dicarboxylate transport system substrate-binding protein